MTAALLFPFLGGAAAFGAVCALVFAATARLAGRRDLLRAAPAVFATLFFLGLTQHPIPAAGALECPVATAAPQLAPFAFVEGIAARWRSGGFAALLGDRLAPGTAMNFLIPFCIGLALVRAGARLPGAAAFGIGLALLAETTQLTGFWGLRPCAWRQFNVDDLIVNPAGVIAGAAAALRLSRRSPKARRSP